MKKEKTIVNKNKTKNDINYEFYKNNVVKRFEYVKNGGISNRIQKQNQQQLKEKSRGTIIVVQYSFGLVHHQFTLRLSIKNLHRIREKIMWIKV